MSSFYGGFIAGGSSGGGGTTNYNDMSNLPITNKTGDEQTPISLEQLDYGRYNLTGYYKLNDGGESLQTPKGAPLDVIITEDVGTGAKIATYDVIKNGELTTILIGFSGQEPEYEEITHGTAQLTWSTF